MRATIKRWGNGLAIRVPRNHPELGRLDQGMEVEIRLWPSRNLTNWKPFTVRTGRSDMSAHHDRYIWGWMDEKYGSPSEVRRPPARPSTRP